jgi:hypothetical protein
MNHSGSRGKDGHGRSDIVRIGNAKSENDVMLRIRSFKLKAARLFLDKESLT